MWDRLFAPLMAAAAGSLTTSLFFIRIFVTHRPLMQMRLVDIASERSSRSAIAAVGCRRLVPFRVRT